MINPTSNTQALNGKVCGYCNKPIPGRPPRHDMLRFCCHEHQKLYGQERIEPQLKSRDEWLFAYHLKCMMCARLSEQVFMLTQIQAKQHASRDLGRCGQCNGNQYLALDDSGSPRSLTELADRSQRELLWRGLT